MDYFLAHNHTVKWLMSCLPFDFVQTRQYTSCESVSIRGGGKYVLTPLDRAKIVYPVSSLCTMLSQVNQLLAVALHQLYRHKSGNNHLIQG